MMEEHEFEITADRQKNKKASTEVVYRLAEGPDEVAITMCPENEGDKCQSDCTNSCRLYAKRHSRKRKQCEKRCLKTRSHVFYVAFNFKKVHYKIPYACYCIYQ